MNANVAQMETERARLRDELLRQLTALGEWRAGNRRAWLAEDVLRVVNAVFGAQSAKET